MSPCASPLLTSRNGSSSSLLNKTWWVADHPAMRHFEIQAAQTRHMTSSLRFGPPSPPSLHYWFRDNEKRLRRWLGRSNSRQAGRTSQIFSACPLRDL